MNTKEMRARAKLNRDCGLPLDAKMIDIAADVVDAATLYCATETIDNRQILRAQLARLYDLPGAS